MRCLEKDPARRFADVGALASALEPYLGHAARASSPRVTRLVEPGVLDQTVPSDAMSGLPVSVRAVATASTTIAAPPPAQRALAAFCRPFGDRADRGAVRRFGARGRRRHASARARGPRCVAHGERAREHGGPARAPRRAAGGAQRERRDEPQRDAPRRRNTTCNTAPRRHPAPVGDARSDSARCGSLARPHRHRDSEAGSPRGSKVGAAHGLPLAAPHAPRALAGQLAVRVLACAPRLRRAHVGRTRHGRGAVRGRSTADGRREIPRRVREARREPAPRSGRRHAAQRRALSRVPGQDRHRVGGVSGGPSRWRAKTAARIGSASPKSTSRCSSRASRASSCRSRRVRRSSASK